MQKFCACTFFLYLQTNSNLEMAQKHKQNIFYVLFKAYLKFFHDKVFYKKVYRLGSENVPEEGNPMIVVSNHQNCLNDPLGLIFSFTDRKPHILTRADVIEYNWFTNSFLRSVGLLPTFRMNFDGEESLSKNKGTFNESEDALIDGNTIIMFPEGMHQDKRWLGEFSTGFTKMAFESAQNDNFQTEVFIQPACNHYSNYFGVQNEMIIKFGTPVSIAPFYELYKTKPRTAQRQVIALVHEQIQNLMLDITDLENYEAIDFIRGVYGKHFAISNNLDANYFPNMLESDKMLFANLEKAKAENNESVANIYSKALEYKQDLKSQDIGDTEVMLDASIMQIVANIISLIVFLPIWIVSLWPNILIFNASNIFMKNIKDKMFEGTIRYTLSVMATIPITYILTFVLTFHFVNGWVAFFYICVLPALAIFAWNYWQFAKRTFRMLKYKKIASDKRKDLTQTRKDLFESLDNILGISK